jgi:hypothetical protein
LRECLAPQLLAELEIADPSLNQLKEVVEIMRGAGRELTYVGHSLRAGQRGRIGETSRFRIALRRQFFDGQEYPGLAAIRVVPTLHGPAKVAAAIVVHFRRFFAGVVVFAGATAFDRAPQLG